MIKLIACAYLFILLIGASDNRAVRTRPDYIFCFSLIVSLLAVIFEIVSFYVLTYSPQLPHKSVLWMHTVDHLLLSLTITAISGDANALLFEDRTQVPRYRRLRRLLCALYLMAAAAVLLNLKSGWLFSVDGAGRYFDGPFVWSKHWFMSANMIVLLAAFLLERKHVRPAFIRVALLLPILVIAVMVMQHLHPEARLEGTLAAMTLTVLFIYGQQQKLYIDHLTTLVSREMFYKTLERFAERKTLFHVIIISLRNYKSVNIRFGQRVGDGFLRLVGIWMSGLEKSAVTCRFSGVEFALIVQNVHVGENGYEALLAKIYERFTQPWEYESHCVTLRESIVDIAYPEHASTVNELISSLEYAVRLAKGAESGNVVRFDNHLRSRAGRRGYVMSQLERALHENRYFIHFQPIYDCHKKRTVGAEALCRMRDASGTIMPGEVIPLAEETEFIHRIDRRVLVLACGFFSENRDCGLEWLSVNISGMEYHDQRTQQWLYDLLEQLRLPGGSIRLEMTERVLIDDMDRACAAAEQLRAHGVGLSMDDFGVGYSNLFSVTRMPLDCVKVDRSLVGHIATNARAQDMLRVVVDGLRKLGARILVEGVETAEQLRIVEQMGVDFVQGYYHARPMSGMDLLDFLASERRYGKSGICGAKENGV